MELSDQIHNLQLHVRELKKQNENTSEMTNRNKDFDLLFTNDDLINVEAIDFSNDENWLCGNSGHSNVDLREWLYTESSKLTDANSYPHHLSSTREATSFKKAVDTRTFTRPKKKYNRPHIEHYTQEVYSDIRNSSDDILAQEIQNYMSSAKCTDSLSNSIISESSDSKFAYNHKPLHFDLNQPSSGNIFDNILMNASDVDSFQNMSPPSLVNSMCSSTFTNLMENSFIKNDPVLREIRDADYSGEILMHDTEPQLYQSFTESCSSLNSDSAENFLRRTLPTLNGTFNFQTHQNSCNSDSEISNNTIIKQGDITDINLTIVDDDEQMNGTFVKSNALKELNHSNNLNNSYTVEGNLNTTFKRNITKDLSCDMSSSNNSDIQCDGVEGSVNLLFRKPQNDHFIEDNHEADRTCNKNTNDCSLTDVYFNSSMTGSTSMKKQSPDKSHSENIDPNAIMNATHPIILSGTFRKTPKLNTSHNSRDINVFPINDFTKQLNKTVSLDNDLDDSLNVPISYNIVDEPDHSKSTCNLDSVDSKVDVKRNSAGYVTGSTDSLDHMSSLSNSSRGSNRMLNMAEVDAIVEEQERSLQVMSTPKPAKSMTKLFESNYISPIIRQKEHVSDSDLSSTDDYLTVRSTLSKGSSGNSEKNLKVLDRNVKSLSNLKQHDQKVKPHNIYTITKPVSNIKPLMASYSNLRASESNIRSSQTNLKSLGTTLKSSYTNLKPVGINLPIITSKPSSAPISHKNTELDQTQIVYNDEVFKVPHVPPAQVKPPSVPNYVKPQARGSCLPRPIATGIPRPVSKIPGPRILRPPSSRPIARLANKPNDG